MTCLVILESDLTLGPPLFALVGMSRNGLFGSILMLLQSVSVFQDLLLFGYS